MEASTPIVRGTAQALPAHYVEQEKLIAAFREHWSERHFNLDRLEELHRAVSVSGRHLALPLEQYPALVDFAARNDAWIKVAEELGAQALRSAADRAQVSLSDIHHLFFVTVTGLATPSIDARLMNRLGLRPDLKRTPIFGLGCVAGAAGLARASDYLRAFPEHNAALLSVELCSLTLQREDLSIPNIIASGLFGDGAAAVVLGGARAGGARRRPRVIASRSVFYPDTERIMGWDVVNTGFKVVLSAKVPSLVKENIARDVDAFLEDHDLSRKDLRHFIAHTGGPKVLGAFEEALQLPREALARSWRSLKEVGNLSSASVLFVLDDLLRAEEARPGDFGLLLAMGPGFCSELVLLQW